MSSKSPTPATAPDRPAASDALVDRIQKNARHLGRWARREGIEAYRLYDRDIPEFPYLVDRYGDWLHVQLLEGKRALTAADVAAHLARLAAALEVPPQRVVLKHRQRQRGKAQYQRLDRDGPPLIVTEHGLEFEVNLHRYLDTGLFLDHRDTRRRVRAEARDRTVLNLFAYTGSFSVYAGAGGARRVVTVDLSRTYQDWTWRNLQRNALANRWRQELVCADVLKFIDEARTGRRRFDLVVLDPPSFSNSKRMDTTFDVQRDQVALLEGVLELVAPGGALYFSTNRQGFKLDPGLSARWAFKEIDHRQTTEDFRRQRAHRCWRIER